MDKELVKQESIDKERACKKELVVGTWQLLEPDMYGTRASPFFSSSFLVNVFKIEMKKKKKKRKSEMHATNIRSGYFCNFIKQAA